MAGVKIKTVGLAALAAALSELPKAASKATLRRVGIKALTPTQAAAQAQAPLRQDPAHEVTFGPKGNRKVRRVGTAKALVQVGTRLTKSQAREARKLGKSEVEIYVGTRDPISRLQEFGTAEMPAHPFMRPAWDAHADEALQIVESELGGEIAKTVARLAKKALKAGGK